MLNRYSLHFSRNNRKLIISALCYEEHCCMGVHSMGAPLMSQICPLFRLRLQTANEYLALGGLVILWHTHKIRQPQDKQVWHAYTCPRNCFVECDPFDQSWHIVLVWILSNYFYVCIFFCFNVDTIPYNVKPIQIKITVQAEQRSNGKYVPSLILHSVGCFHLEHQR